VDRLAILKALGDNTRYAIYLELARAASPLATADVAESLGLHPNTVRPHLERMREVGLLAVESNPGGGPGRPQHRYSLAPDSPGLGLEPPSFPMLARMLLRMAEATGAGAEEALDAGRDQGRTDAPTLAGRSCLAAVEARMAELGFDPAVATEEQVATVAFAHCPFRDLAEERPDLICNLHRGLVEGLVAGVGGATVEAFGTLVDRAPCRVDLRLDDQVDEPLPVAGR